jgi:glycosyltransferase involved in cell wall biosynthesis
MGEPMSASLRVLISAYACEPCQGSEPGIGWNWVRQAARFHEVWVITRANNRPRIEEALSREPLPRTRFIYFDLPRWARFWKKGSRGVHLYYYLWQMGAYFLGRKLHREFEFNVVHHVTLGTYWMPSFLALLRVPFVWGPVGGGESAPRGFRFRVDIRAEIYEILRDLARFCGRMDPFVRATARRAELALATSAETERVLPTLGCRKVAVLSQVGLPAEEILELASLPPRNGTPFRVASLGRLLHWKGVALGLRAFAELNRENPASEYWVIGNGPELRTLQGLAQKLGVAEKVTFWGQMPRRQVLEKLAECDVLLHPSLHDSGGWVCLEAMAAGRPVICLDLGGPALQVTERTGIKVPAREPEQTVRDLATALTRLAADPVLRARLGFAARQRVQEHFTWDGKGDIWSMVRPRAPQHLLGCTC